MKRDFNCYVCGSTHGKEYFSISNYPAYIVPLPAEQAADVVKGNLPLYACDACGHMQVPSPDAVLQKKIYEEYYSYYVVDKSEALLAHYRNPFIAFLDSLKASNTIYNGDVLEIGCSSGEKVEYFSSFGKSYTGVDPSENIEIAKKKYPEATFVKGYFPQALPEKARFDTVISQFNLEHIGNVNDFVRSVFLLCNEGGLFITQVPDINFFTRTRQPNFLAHEHIQYFTKETLELLLRENGFTPVAWGEEGPSLICAAKKDSSAAVQHQPADVEQVLNKVREHAALFNVQVDLPEDVIFYGVGPQLFWLIDKYKGDLRKASIVDDNPSYKNLSLPGYGNPITTLSKELVAEKGNIVLSLNNIYHEKVLQKIKMLNVPCTVTLNENGTWKTKTI